MARMIKNAPKNCTPFNFDIYKSKVNQLFSKLQNSIQDQIKCLEELESEVESVILDDKNCIFMETPTQHRRRIFDNIDIAYSSPLLDVKSKQEFKSVVKNNTVKITHFNDESLKYKLDFDFTSHHDDPVNMTQTKPTNLKNNSTKGKYKSVRKSKDKQNSFKETSTILAKNILEKKEKRIQRAAEVERRRKALEEERRLKLSKKFEPKQNMDGPISRITSTISNTPCTNNNIHALNKTPCSFIKTPILKPISLTDIDSKARRDTFDLKENKNVVSYKMTPETTFKKPIMPSLDVTYTTYDIDDLKSSDNTDDENDPDKPIPFWAQDKILWRSIYSQNVDVPIDGEQVFGPMKDITRENIFPNPNSRFYERTSSAFWEPSMIDANFDDSY